MYQKHSEHTAQPLARVRNMKKLCIIKLGTTFAAIKKQFGDFDAWTLAALGASGVETCVLDAEHGAALPAPADCAGVVVTGSHAMVTDGLPWSIKAEAWISSLLEAKIPYFGICYGHQLLARAAGGRAGFHPRGMEIGTVEIRLCPDCVDDPLFGLLPQRFSVHATHAQTVLALPPGAIRLAESTHESHHAFRLGDCAWGVQFHPEYDIEIMRSYIMAQADELEQAGRNVSELLHSVSETPVAAQIIRNFARIVEERMAKETMTAM
jgi:GMP synthase (glutamine-hydrolysing)